MEGGMKPEASQPHKTPERLGLKGKIIIIFQIAIHSAHTILSLSHCTFNKQLFFEK